MNPDLLKRRGGARNERGRDADKRAGKSELAQGLVGHFLACRADNVDTLAVDLDPRRRHVPMLDLSASELGERLNTNAATLPSSLCLHVRFSSQYDCPLDEALLASLHPRVHIGRPERDVGRFPLIQIADACAPANRVRIGRLTALVRAALASTQVVRDIQQGGTR